MLLLDRIFLYYIHATMEDMIAMKKAAGRVQDLSDIMHLERFLNEAK